MPVTPLKCRNRTLEAVKDSRPKFHPIQVCAQPFKTFDQISHDRICCLLRHSWFTRQGFFWGPSVGLKSLAGSGSPTERLRNQVLRTGLDTVLSAGVSLPDLTSITAAFAVIPSNKAGSAPVIQT